MLSNLEKTRILKSNDLRQLANRAMNAKGEEKENLWCEFNKIRDKLIAKYNIEIIDGSSAPFPNQLKDLELSF